MIVHGRVQNGVVVLDGCFRFPEGQEVIVVGPGTPAPAVGQASSPHSILDIPPVSLGSVLNAPTGDDDLLGEMLDGRP